MYETAIFFASSPGDEASAPIRTVESGQHFIRDRHDSTARAARDRSAGPGALGGKVTDQYENRLASIESRLHVLVWMVGTNLAVTLAVLAKLLR